MGHKRQQDDPPHVYDAATAALLMAKACGDAQAVEAAAGAAAEIWKTTGVGISSQRAELLWTQAEHARKAQSVDVATALALESLEVLLVLRGPLHEATRHRLAVGLASGMFKGGLVDLR